MIDIISIIFPSQNNNETLSPRHTEEEADQHLEENSKETQNWLEVASGSLLCLWSVRQPSFPKRILTCRSPPLAATFSPGRLRVVIAGLNDGSLAAWDLRENPSRHPSVVTIEGSKWRLSPPSYITACSLENVIEGSPIVALDAVRREDEGGSFSNAGSFQVCAIYVLAK